MGKRVLSLLTALAFCLCLLPPGARAADVPEDKSTGWVFKYAYEVPRERTEYTAGGGRILWEPVLDAAGTKVVSGTLTLRNAQIETTGSGIHSPVDTTIVLEGSNSITVTQVGISNAGILIDNYDTGSPGWEKLTLKGTGALSINSKRGGIVSKGDMLIDGISSLAVNTEYYTNCISVQQGDLTIRNSSIDGTDSGGVTNLSGILNAQKGSIIVEDSNVTAISDNGYAMHVGTSDNGQGGKIQFTNSHIVAIGKVAAERGDTPISFDQFVTGYGFQMSGGTLYVENTDTTPGETILDFPNKSDKAIATDSAVIFFNKGYMNLIENGNHIHYINCSYDETTRKVTPGNGYIRGTVEWNDNLIVVPDENKTLYAGYKSGGQWYPANIVIPQGSEVTIPATGYVIALGEFENNGHLTNNGTIQIQSTGSLKNNNAADNSGNILNKGGKIENTGTINNYNLTRLYPSAQLVNTGTINGIINEFNGDKMPKDNISCSYGDAVQGADTLTAGENSEWFQPVYIPAETSLTIPAGKTLDASRPDLNVTSATLGTYLDVQGNLIVNGTLQLPAGTTEQQIEDLHLSGTGTILIGTETYYPVNVTGGTTDKTAAKAGETVTLTPDNITGKNFTGWQSSDVTINTDGTFTMPDKAISIEAQFETIAFTVSIDKQDGSAVSNIIVNYGETVPAQTEPTRKGYIFGGWYTDSECTEEYGFDTPVTSGFTLYAKWGLAVSDVTLSTDVFTLTVGEDFQLTAEVQPEDAVNNSVTWSSSDENVATVDETGKVIAVDIGTAVITAEAGGKRDTCTVTVEAADIPVEEVTLDMDALTLEVGEDSQLTAAVQPGNATNSTIHWSSDNENVATVDETGKVTAVGAGTAVITAEAGGKRDTCTVTVEEPQGGDIDIKVEVEPGLAEIPEGLQELFETVEEIIEALYHRVQAVMTGTGDQIAVYDVTLQYFDGSSWHTVTPEDFPAAGVDAVLPYPDGTGPSGWQFTVQHMISSGENAGEIETLEYTAAGSGLKCHFSSMSPVAIGYEKVEEKPSGGGSGSSGGGASHVVRNEYWYSASSKLEPERTYGITIGRTEGGRVSTNYNEAAEGKKITLTAVPEDGWILESLTVTDSRGDGLRLTETDEGMYTFTMPAHEVTANAMFARAVSNEPKHEGTCPSLRFSDLDTNEWYHEAVDFTLESGLMNGTGTAFAPGKPLTRAMFAQILYSHAGKPTGAPTASFRDTVPGEWYMDAVNWAVSSGVVSGYSDGRFAPQDSVTREQLAVMLWRYAGQPAAGQAALVFADADAASGYAREALCWAVENHILSGSGGMLLPGGAASRAQAAQMLKSFLQK